MELVVSFSHIRLAKIGIPRPCSCHHHNYHGRIKLYYWIIKNYALLRYSCSVTCWTWWGTNGILQGRTLRHSLRYIVIFCCPWHIECNGKFVIPFTMRSVSVNWCDDVAITNYSPLISILRSSTISHLKLKKWWIKTTQDKMVQDYLF